MPAPEARLDVNPISSFSSNSMSSSLFILSLTSSLYYPYSKAYLKNDMVLSLKGLAFPTPLLILLAKLPLLLISLKLNLDVLVFLKSDDPNPVRLIPLDGLFIALYGLVASNSSIS